MLLMKLEDLSSMILFIARLIIADYNQQS